MLDADVQGAIELLLDPAYASDVRIIEEETQDGTWYSLEFMLLESNSYGDGNTQRCGPWITANSNGVQFDLDSCEHDERVEYLSFGDESMWLLGVCAGHFGEICRELNRRGHEWYCQQCGNTGFYPGSAGEVECGYCDTLDKLNREDEPTKEPPHAG
jgi:hypothetical protein